MYCGNCGWKNSTDGSFCEHCGARLTGNSGVMPEAGAEETQPAAQPDPVDPIFRQIFTQPGDSSQTSAAENQAVPTEQVSAAHTPSKPGRPAKSGKKLWIIFASVLAAIAIICAAGFVFRMKIIKAVSPETYLQMSLTKTMSGSAAAASKAVDLSKYTGGAVSHDLSVESDDFSFDGSLKYDAENEKALLAASAGMSGEDSESAELYVSMDQIAFSCPSLISDTDYVTIDPKTFAKEWSDAGFDEYSNFSDSDVADAIHSFFGKSTDAGEETGENADLLKQYAEIAADMKKNTVFFRDGTVDEKIMGEKLHLDVMGYKIPEDAANDIYQETISLLKAQIEERMDKAAETSPDINGDDYRDMIDELFSGLEDLEIDDDIVITYYIDQSARVRKIVIDDFEISSESDITLGFEMELGEGSCPTDNFDAVLNIEADGEEAAVELARESSFREGKYKDDITMTLGSDDEEIVFSIDTAWDKEDTSGNNLEISFSGETGSDSFLDVTITGTLTDEKDKTSLSDGLISFDDEYGDSMEINFAYSISKIDASEISVDTSDSIPLMQYEPFLNYMEESDLSDLYDIGSANIF